MNTKNTMGRAWGASARGKRRWVAVVVAFLPLLAAGLANRTELSWVVSLALVALGAAMGAGVYLYYFSGHLIAPAQKAVAWREHPGVIIESDDWGVARMFSDQARLDQAKGLTSKQFDTTFEAMLTSTLESPKDLERLFAILGRSRGVDGLPAVVTANYVVCSPDYEAMEADGPKRLRWQRIPLLAKGWLRGDYVEKAKQGVSKGIWQPEYHAFLHMNPFVWLKALRAEDPLTRAMFDLESYADMDGRSSPEYCHTQSRRQQRWSIAHGTAAFQAVFGRPAISSIAPYFIWQRRTEALLRHQGIRVIQAKNRQREANGAPWAGLIERVAGLVGLKTSFDPKKIKSGDVNTAFGLTYLRRNVDFEPLINPDPEYLESVKRKVLEVWKQGEPIVINSHRYNYASLDGVEAERCSALLQELLEWISKTLPGVRYLTDGEAAQVFSDGVSQRQFGTTLVLRSFLKVECEMDLELPPGLRAHDATFVVAGREWKTAVGKDRVVLPPLATCRIDLQPAAESNRIGLIREGALTRAVARQPTAVADQSVGITNL
jgi:hypothetical protein